jgi:hypothetical protein
MADFAYNKSHHEVIRCSPLHAHMGRNPHMEFELAEREQDVPEARNGARHMLELHVEMTKLLDYARKT